MSQYPHDPLARPVQQTNGLGIAGFVCSLVGLFTGGLLCPIGLILSLVALGRQPKGFAVAGLILGLLGTCGGIIVFLLFGTLILGALGIAAAAVILSESERFEITFDMDGMATAIRVYEDEHGALPASLDDLELPEAMRTDPWARRYAYRLTPGTAAGFDVISAGPDGQFDTEDDLMLSRRDQIWEGAFGESDQPLPDDDRPEGVDGQGEDETAEREPAESAPDAP